MKFIRQGATHKVVCGPAVAVANGYVPVTNLALSSADEAEVILHDNGTVVDISGYTWAAITTADGYYHLTLQSGISGTVGHMTVVVNDDSLCLPLREDFTILEEAVYDAMFAASAPGYVVDQPVNVTKWLGTAAATPTVAGVPEVDVTHWIGAAAATPTTAGVPEVDVTFWRGTIVPAEHTAGYPVVTVKDGTGTGEINTNAGAIAVVDLVTTVTDVTNYHASGATAAELAKVPKSDGTASWNATALAAINTQADLALSDYDGPTNAEFELRSLPAADYFIVSDYTAPLSAAQTNAEVDTALADAGLGPIRANTAQGGTASTITLDASASGTLHFYRGAMISLTGGTGVGQSRHISGYNHTTKVASVKPDWITTPDNTTTFVIAPDAASNVVQWNTDTLPDVITTSNISDYIWSATKTGYSDTDTFGGVIAQWITSQVASQTSVNTAQADLDILTGSDGVTLATAQANYAPSTAAALASLVTTVGAAGAGLTEAGGTGDQLTALATAAALAAVAADLPTRITKNTELAAFPFKMVDETDHVTAETGLTVTATRSLDGAAFAACANAVSEIANGWYKITLAAADLNANTVILRFTATGADTNEVVIVTEPT